MFEERNQRKWKKIKPKGKRSYLVNTGILFYGVIIFVTWVFLVPYIEGGFTYTLGFRETFLTKALVFGILSPFLGIFLAQGTWKDFEKRYR